MSQEWINDISDEEPLKVKRIDMWVATVKPARKVAALFPSKIRAGNSNFD